YLSYAETKPMFCKDSASRGQSQIYLSYAETKPMFCKDSASRGQSQIYLGYAEAKLVPQDNRSRRIRPQAENRVGRKG
ncbi:MAG: hypothetical protein K2L06_02510, partial [Alistipes sp.]|nr:hypothetical protein [Alistipes sp.]